MPAGKWADAGDGAALDEMYRRHGQAVLRIAYHLTGTLEDAEDVVQDVWLGLLLALRPLP